MNHTSHAVKDARDAHRRHWTVSGVLGLALLGYAATLYSGGLAAPIVTAPSSVAPPAAAPTDATSPLPVESPAACRIPAQALAPAVQAVSKDIARRFHLAESAAAGITHAAFTAGRRRGIDPVLVLAVAAVESKFKSSAVNPVTGATGLMQVMPQWHQDKIKKLGGDPAMLLIEPNITVGTAILAEYLEAEDGNLEQALGRYLGSAGGDHYKKRVRVEMQHLANVVSRT
jgi:soluble lytic murein transglycosylase-like protein